VVIFHMKGHKNLVTKLLVIQRYKNFPKLLKPPQNFSFQKECMKYKLHILGTTVQHLVTMATWHLVFVHPCSNNTSLY
jgi:hypothetical protein